jgi:hypothetical protein
MDSLGDIKAVGVNEKTDTIPEHWTPPTEWLTRFVDEYSGKHGGDTETLPAGSDPERVAAAVFTMNEEDSVAALKAIIKDHHQDYTFDKAQMHRLAEIVEGNQACGMEYGEWGLQPADLAPK